MSSFQDVKVNAVTDDTITLRVTECHPDSVALASLKKFGNSLEERTRAARFAGWLLRNAPPFNRNAFASWVATRWCTGERLEGEGRRPFRHA